MVFAHKSTLSFKIGCKTLSVSFADSSPKGRAKMGAYRIRNGAYHYDTLR